MGLTPLDIENTKFRGALAGFNRLEVEHFMQRVASTIEEKLEEIQRLRGQVSALEEDVQKNREIEDLLKNSLILAQKTCDELITSAHRKADLIVLEAQAEGQQIKRQFADLKGDQEQFEYAFYGLLSGFMHRLEQGNPALVKPADIPALPSEQRVEQQVSPFEEQAIESLDSEPDVHSMHQSPEIITDQKPPSAKLPFSQKQELPKVKLTQAQGPGVDRDADIDDFENAVADAKTDEPPSWTPPSAPDENEYAEPESGE